MAFGMLFFSASNTQLFMANTTMIPPISLAVYCGSRMGHHPDYETSAIAVGHWVGERGGQLVYGGGKNGLMGIVANAALDAGAHVVGVIPQALMDREHGNTRCSELFIVKDMHERKAMMEARSNGFVALAGGIGTFEEIIEQWVWNQLNYHNKPLGLLNTRGFYDGLIQFAEHSKAEGFMDAKQMALLKVNASAPDLLASLYSAV
jgi:uncharacterized protein (TIGR00730 family)